jgi:hypothetical protein
MPYDSEAQRRYMHWAHPEIAARWDKETGGKVMADMDLAKKSPKKPPPMMAVSIGAAKPEDDAPAEGDHGDDEEEALKAGGDAAIAALHAGDGLSFARALVAIQSASDGGMGTAAADLDMVGGKDFGNDGHEED